VYQRHQDDTVSPYDPVRIHGHNLVLRDMGVDTQNAQNNSYIGCEALRPQVRLPAEALASQNRHCLSAFALMYTFPLYSCRLREAFLMLPCLTLEKEIGCSRAPLLR
jgi:hypothetical protein